MKVLFLIALLVSCCPVKPLPQHERTEYLKCEDNSGNKYILICPAFGPVEIIKIK